MTPEVLYRIYTEDKPEYREEIVRTLRDHGLPHFTFVSAEGYGPDQDGKSEHTVVVEITTSPEREPAVSRAVKMLKLRNGQGSVKLVCVGVAGALMTDPAFRVSVTQDGRVGVLVRDPEGDVPTMSREELSAAIRSQIRRGREKIESSPQTPRYIRKRVEGVRSVDEKTKQILLHFVRTAIELGMENRFYRRKQGEIGHIKQNPDFIALEGRFRPLLVRLETAVNQEAADQQILEVLEEISAMLNTLSQS